MSKGFSITCMNCGEKMIVDNNLKTEDDCSNITISVMNEKNDLLYFVCTNCGNEIEAEV